MKVEGVSAGVAANQIRERGDEGSHADDRGAEEAAPAMKVPRSQNRDLGHPAFRTWTGFYSLLPIPSSLIFHGRSRSLCCWFAESGAGVKEGAKVRPLWCGGS